MADEKRRLIYELIVEAVGAKKAHDTVKDIGNSMGQLARAAGPVGAAIAGAFTIKNFADSLDNLHKFEAQLEAIGVTGKATQTALTGVNDVAFRTGAAFDQVGSALQESIQLQQALGRSVDNAAYSTDAFIRVAMSEGRTAADAAAQIKQLTFALESGTLSGAQFNRWLKESGTFQKAAQEALGKTTEQLVAMGKAGDLTGPQLVAIIQHLEKIGQSKEAAETVDTFTNKLKTLFNIAAQGLGRGAAGGAPSLGAPDPDAISGWTVVKDNVEGVTIQIGALGKATKNYVDLAGDEVYLFFKSLANLDEPEKAWAAYTKTQKEDIAELQEAWRRFNEEGMKGLPDDPNYDPEARAKKRAELEKQNAYARWKAEEDAIHRAEAERLKVVAANNRKVDEEIAARREKEEKDAAEKAKRAAEQRKKEQMDFYDDRERELQQSLEKQARETKDMLKDFGVAELQETLDNMTFQTIPGLRDSWIDSFEQIGEVTATLEASLGGLFSGAITSANDFFNQLINGIADVFAQLAAKQAAEGIMDFLGGLFGGFSGFTGTSAATQAGSGLTGAFRNYAAKGRAFNNGWEIPMGTGGVVSGPTVFPMAGGAGLMGEAGPEAVMPLKRTSGGRLGVSAAMPSITIVNRLGVPASARMERSNDRMTVVMEAAQLGASLAQSRMNRSLRTGYGDAARSIQGTYGLRRK